MSDYVEADTGSDSTPESSATTTTVRTTVPEAPASSGRAVIEQVVVALILAFVFRAFVVEAFIIPTGSMATTLLGAHMRFDCPDCGWDFTVNYQSPQGSSGAILPTQAKTNSGLARKFNIRCPNCAYRFPADETEGFRADSEDSYSPPVYYGDRILVLKHQYLFAEPGRFEVVVFKNPSSVQFRKVELRPEQATEPFQENYIKRLVGLPGDTLMILDGDIYVADDVRNKETGELVASDFRIARKPASAQSALWRTVYDDDYRPRGLDRNSAGFPAEVDFDNPWRPGGAWQQVEGGFEVDAGGGTLEFDPDAVREAFYLTDFLGYDQTHDDIFESDNNRKADTSGNRYGFNGRVGGNPYLHRADDLKLDLVHTRQSGDGPLVLRLDGNGEQFELLIDGEGARLTHNGTTVATVEEDDLSPDGSARRIEFQHVDYAVAALVDGRPLLDYTYDPIVESLIEAESRGDAGPVPAAAVAARGHDGSLRHVKLLRDVHYTPRDQTSNQSNANPSGQFYPHASPADFPRNVMRLGEEEFFVIGDNPMLSGDARTWDSVTDAVKLAYEEVDVEGGRVPRRFMLGKAFFVYWPGGYRPLPFLPPIVPNFGEMRLIR